ncbi:MULTISPECIES: hypothetical protein [Micromonospora]|uniref:Peptidoglycan-binding protein n=1 Tax=Micromonospora carbonacea TaxID=47853 RepID=A0A7H8XN96_9ACTN|nr:MULTISPECIES: hypothetical protein [Micromonospora]MBB5826529.1 hypothetical protein [Micromonospora carbonacea]QLD26038.1 hypothetical protein HXZ27_19010 [Micromonospora carbonacea]WFE55965.1 hypothetical protein O7633_03430 [Micromonospora sp. WMMD712]
MSTTRPTLRRRAVTLLVAALAALGVTLGFASPALAITHSSAASQLSAAGISWTSSGNCSDRYTATCTSFDGIRQATIDGIITFKRVSGCAITITAGTEVGHADGAYSHWTGYKLDIGLTTCVQNYISAHFAYVGYIPGFGYQYRSASGNLYTKEGNHWDILYYTCGC